MSRFASREMTTLRYGCKEMSRLEKQILRTSFCSLLLSRARWLWQRKDWDWPGSKLAIYRHGRLPSCSALAHEGYVPRCATYVSIDTGANINTLNLGIPGWHSGDLLDALQNGTLFIQALRRRQPWQYLRLCLKPIP